MSPGPLDDSLRTHATIDPTGRWWDRRAGRCRRPNILVVLAADLGYADLSCYGRRDYDTRNIDRLAAQGVKLNQGYANSSVCSPTRVALITGRYQYRLACGLEEPQPPWRDTGLPPEHPTLPSLLRKRGYQTSLAGKWHMGVAPKYGPLGSGYDRFFGIYEGGADYVHYGLKMGATAASMRASVRRPRRAI